MSDRRQGHRVRTPHQGGPQAAAGGREGDVVAGKHGRRGAAEGGARFAARTEAGLAGRTCSLPSTGASEARREWAV